MPSIQYRVIKGQAAIFSCGEGVDNSLRMWLLSRQGSFKLGNREMPLLISGMEEKIHTLSLLPTPKLYRIMDYLPLNTENYLRWKRAESLHERIELLERILAGNIITFVHHLGWRLPDRLEVKLMAIREMKTITVHGTQRIAFNLIYKANIDLPSWHCPGAIGCLWLWGAAAHPYSGLRKGVYPFSNRVL